MVRQGGSSARFVSGVGRERRAAARSDALAPPLVALAVLADLGAVVRRGMHELLRL